MGKTGKRPNKPKGNGKSASAKKPTPGCYVLSLSVENVRCFGEKQTLDCSDGEGKHRQWTVILGDNGTGKSTLLLMTAIFEFFRYGYAQDSGLRLLRSYDLLGKTVLEVEQVKTTSDSQYVTTTRKGKILLLSKIEIGKSGRRKTETT